MSVHNIVFDMGGVLLDWNPFSYASQVSDSQEDADLIFEALFMNHAWSLGDSGTLSDQWVLESALSKLPERLHRACEVAWRTYPEMQAVISETNELGRQLHEAGFGVYILSNVSNRFRAELEPRIPLSSCTDGILISAEELLMKPDPRIFTRFCQRFDVDADDCLFVDDLELNCQGARAAGWHAFQFNGAIEPLKCEVSKLMGFNC